LSAVHYEKSGEKLNTILICGEASNLSGLEKHIFSLYLTFNLLWYFKESCHAEFGTPER
jgi:hypothetical protein